MIFKMLRGVGGPTLNAFYSMLQCDPDRLGRTATLQPAIDFVTHLTPRCRTLKVPKVGAFSPYLRVTTFGGFEIYTQKCMTLRDFDDFLFFP